MYYHIPLHLWHYRSDRAPGVRFVSRRRGAALPLPLALRPYTSTAKRIYIIPGCNIWTEVEMSLINPVDRQMQIIQLFQEDVAQRGTVLAL